MTVTVRVVMAAPEGDTLTCVGLKVQLMPAGTPAQPRFTGPAEPFVEASDKVKLAEVPTAMVAEVLGPTVALTVPTTSVAG